MNIIVSKHFVCSECGGVSKQSGTCQTDDCIQQGLGLKECHCEDTKHDGVVNHWKKDDSNEPEASQVKTIDLDSEAE